MSIEISGPRGYEYQYMMTVLTALKAVNFNSSELSVEQEGGEDAEVRRLTKQGYITIEIQVKSERNRIDLSKLATWLSHFPDKQAENNLLNRLKEDPNRYVLFIAGGRCADETQPFCSNSFVEEHKRSPLIGRSADSFLDSLFIQHREPSPISIQRNHYCEQQATYLRSHKRELRLLTKRILIWEKMDKADVKLEILKLLRLEHFIPEGVAESVLLELDEAVRNSRDDRQDLLPAIQCILSKNSSQRIFTSLVHINREEFRRFNEELNTQHAILLTGISFCGKTHTAEFLAEDFRSKGFTCTKTSDVLEALRTLTDMNPENRLCILEDPFGGTELSDDSLETWSKLHNLVSRVGAHRKLIVTSRNDLIQMITRESRSSEWKIDKFNWHNLTVTNVDLAINIWEAYCKEKHVEEDVRRKITEGMTEGIFILQPGQLRHLAFIDQIDLKDKSQDELEQMAKADATLLGQSFLSRRNIELELTLIVLGLCSSQTSGISEGEFFRILSGISGMSLELFKPQIEYLESHGYLKCNDYFWEFSHPTYFEAAMFVAEHQGRFQRKYLEEIITLATESSERQIPLAVLKKQLRLYLKYKSDPNFKKVLLEHSILCLKHDIPAVRDAALSFAISQMEDFESVSQKALIRHIETGGISDLNIQWENGMPYVKQRSDMRDFITYHQNLRLSENKRDEILERLAFPNPANIVFPEEAWKVSHYLYIFANEDTTSRYLKQLMTYDESFIRRKAAEFIMSHFATNLDLVELVFQDSHPIVVKSGLKGSIESWPNFSKETKDVIKPLLIDALTKSEICAASNKFLVKFSKDYMSDGVRWNEMSKVESIEVWSIWGELFPVFLNNVPITFLNIDQPYLFTTLKEAAKFLDDSINIKLAEAWFNWLDRYLKTSVPTDYGLANADFLLSTVKEPSLRHGLGSTLLNYNDTALVTVTLAEYMYYWASLSQVEQVEVINLLKKERKDYLWLCALIITRKQIPEPIFATIIDDIEILQQEPEKWIERLPVELVSAGLSVVTGNPGLLGSVGYTNTDNGRWRQILFQLFTKPSHAAFPIAIQGVINSVFLKLLKEEEIELIERNWKDLLSAGDSFVNETCFTNLLKMTILINIPQSKQLWTYFFQEISPELQDDYLERIVDQIEVISTNCDYIHEIFGEDVSGKLYAKLSNDRDLINIMHEDKIRELKVPKDVIQKRIEQNPPRLLQTCNMLERIYNFSIYTKTEDEEPSSFIKARNHIFDQCKEQNGQYLIDDDPINWIFQSKVNENQ